MDKIFTANDKAKEKGYPSWRELLFSFAKEKKWNMTGKTGDQSVTARIDFGRWLADCPICNSAVYVEPADPIFYCFTCKNGDIGGDFISVTFPKNRAGIEAEILLREVVLQKGLPPTDAAAQALPKVAGLVRSWNPDESIERLQKQREIASALF